MPSRQPEANANSRADLVIQTPEPAAGVPHHRAGAIAHTVAIASGPIQNSTAGVPDRLAHAVALDFAHATHTVVLLMALVMAVAFLIAVITMPRTRTATAPDLSTPEASRR